MISVKWISFFLIELLDKSCLASWTNNKYLITSNLDLQQFLPPQPPERTSSSLTNRTNTNNNNREEEEDTFGKNQSLSSQFANTNTANSSRKSSISEAIISGTPPAASLSKVSSRTLVNERDSITISDEYAMSTTELLSSRTTAKNSMSLSNPTNLLISTSGAIFHSYTNKSISEKYIVPYPKMFCVKFSGLPEQLLIMRNEEFIYNPSTSKYTVLFFFNWNTVYSIYE